MKIYSLSLLILILLFLPACSSYHKESESKPDKLIYVPEHAKGFRIEGYNNDNNSIITIKNPWQGAEDIVSEIYIVKDSVFLDGYKGQMLKGIPERIVCMSSTHIALLEVLDATDKIVGVSGIGFISNPKIQARKDRIADVGYDGNIDYEKLAAAKPDLVLLYSVSGVSEMEGKLKELGIPFMYFGEYVENNPLGKAEWIVVMAELLGKRDVGIHKFKEIESNYSQVKKRVAHSTVPRPKVMLNMPYGEAWYMASSNSYIATLIKDAGGEYIYKKDTGNASLPIERETALKMVLESDFWINFGAITNLLQLKTALPKYKDIILQKEGKLFNDNNRRTSMGGNDCYESGIVNPDLILRDLIKIFHPNLVEEEFVYYQPLK